MISAAKLRILHTIGKHERMHGESMARALETGPAECVEPENQGRSEGPGGLSALSPSFVRHKAAGSTHMRHRRTIDDKFIPVAG